MNILIENIINYCELSGNKRKLNELCTFLNMEKSMNILKNNIAYPGLL